MRKRSLGALTWLAALVSIAVVALPAQTTLEINGVIVDSATNQGIAGVLVSVEGRAADPKAEAVYLDALTDVSGRFRVAAPHEGAYSLSLPNPRGYQGTVVRAIVSAADPAASVRIVLHRKTEVLGRAVEEGTGDPVAGVPLFLTKIPPVSPLPFPGVTNGIRVTSGEDGRFRDSALSSGKWAVHVVPRLWATSARHLTSFSEEDARQTDEDFVEMYWPGGGALDAVLPMPVAAGLPTDFGAIPIRKTTYYRVRLSLAPQSCEPGESFQGTLLLKSSQPTHSWFSLGCGQEILLRGLLPRTTYQVELKSNASSATMPLVTADRNSEVTIAPIRGVDLEGRVVLAEGAQKRPKTLRFGWQGSVVTPDANGRFRLTRLPLGEAQIAVVELSPEFMITEVRLAGIPQSRGTPLKFTWSGTGALEVVVDDQAPVVTGVVMEGDHPAQGAMVLVGHATRPEAPDAAVTDAQGRFATRVPAGEYRVVAIPLGSFVRTAEPGVLQRLLTNGARISIGRGGSAAVTLPLREP